MKTQLLVVLALMITFAFHFCLQQYYNFQSKTSQTALGSRSLFRIVRLVVNGSQVITESVGVR